MEASTGAEEFSGLTPGNGNVTSANVRELRIFDGGGKAAGSPYAERMVSAIPARGYARFKGNRAEAGRERGKERQQRPRAYLHGKNLVARKLDDARG